MHSKFTRKTRETQAFMPVSRAFVDKFLGNLLLFSKTVHNSARFALYLSLQIKVAAVSTSVYAGLGEAISREVEVHHLELLGK